MSKNSRGRVRRCKNANCKRVVPSRNKYYCSLDCLQEHQYNEGRIELEHYCNSNVPAQEIFYEPTKTISAHTNY